MQHSDHFKEYSLSARLEFWVLALDASGAAKSVAATAVTTSGVLGCAIQKIRPPNRDGLGLLNPEMVWAAEWMWEFA